jgi:hypothetical protein
MSLRAITYHASKGRHTWPLASSARKIVHLLNEINTTANRALPENNPSQREETVPPLNIKVALADSKAKNAFQEPGHQQLELKKTDEGVEVIVPRLDVHTMVVFE